MRDKEPFPTFCPKCGPTTACWCGQPQTSHTGTPPVAARPGDGKVWAIIRAACGGATNEAFNGEPYEVFSAKLDALAAKAEADVLALLAPSARGEEEQCVRTVAGESEYAFYRCAMPVAVERNGRFFCADHDPDLYDANGKRLRAASAAGSEGR